MRVALITPTAHLKDAPDTGYYLVLAQRVLSDPEYAAYYSLEQRLRRSTAPNVILSAKEQFTILDNGAAEGVKLSDADLVEAVKMIQPDIVIAPDDLDSGPMTIWNTTRFVSSREFAVLDQRPGVMVVPHGDTYEEWVRCLEALMPLKPAMIGVARKHTFLGTLSPLRGRADLVNYVNSLYPNIPVHLLGLAGSPMELVAMAMKDEAVKVKGVDTALPWVIGRHGLLFDRDFGVLGKPDSWHSDESLQLAQGEYLLRTCVSNCWWLVHKTKGVCE